MTLSQPRLTIGVPVYNGAGFIGATLAALAAQDFPDFTVLVADNGSTDASTDICQDFAATDARFSVMTSEVNRGIPWNYNRLLAAAESELFMWNDADDVCSPHHVGACIAALDANPQAVLAYGDVITQEPSGEIHQRPKSHGLVASSPQERLRVMYARDTWLAVGNGAVIRSAELKSAGGLPRYAHGDITLASALAVAGPWVCTGQVSYTVHHHEAQLHRAVERDVRDLTRVYRPDFHGRFAFPAWYQQRRLFSHLAGTSGTPRDRLGYGAAALAGWTVPQWRVLGVDVKRNLQSLQRQFKDSRSTTKASA